MSVSNTRKYVKYLNIKKRIRHLLNDIDHKVNWYQENIDKWTKIKFIDEVSES